MKEALGNVIRRDSAKYSFTIKAKDVFKYGATEGCIGCKFVLGTITYQCGHSNQCKLRMVEKMEKDKIDKHRVEKWEEEKGIN